MLCNASPELAAQNVKMEKRWFPHEIIVEIVVIAFISVNSYFSYKYYTNFEELNSEKNALLSRVNVTNNSNDQILFFNRVPKAGSTNLVVLLQALSELDDKNFNIYGFNIGSDGIDVEQSGMSEYDEAKTVRQIYNACERNNTTTDLNKPNPGCVMYRHMHFINYEEFNFTNPIYINFVRHPVERLQSWFYYVRSTEYMALSTGRDMTVRRLKGTLDECVLKTKPCQINVDVTAADFIKELFAKQERMDEFESKGGFEMMSRNDISRILLEEPTPHDEDEDRIDAQKDEVSSQIDYFCGYGPECGITAGKRRLYLAMKNVERYYAAVGVLEEMEKSLAVFESLVPKYFKGAAEVEKIKKEQKANSNFKKPKLSPEARKLLEFYLDEEIQFYYFCRQRLHLQYNVINL